MSNQKDIKLPEGLQNYIQQSRNNNNRGENEDDFNTCWSLKSMFAFIINGFQSSSYWSDRFVHVVFKGKVIVYTDP